MEFQYVDGSASAIHNPTGATILIGRTGPNDEVTLRFDKGAEAKVPNEEADGILDRLRQEIEGERVRIRFQHLVDVQFAREFWLVESALAQHPTRRVTKRTIQSWLSPKDRKSSRRCPAWAVSALEDYLERHPDTRERIQKRQARQMEARTSSFERFQWNDEMWNTNSEAEAEIGREAQLCDRLSSAPTSAFADVVAQEFVSMSRRLDSLDAIFQNIMTALREADDDTTVKDFNKSLTDLLITRGLQNGRVRQTQLDLEKNAEEFASEDGTLPRGVPDKPR